MSPKEKIKITVQVNIHAPIDKVWKCWNSPQDIIKWNTASEDWHTTHATNDLKVGGKFLSRMEAKDGSMGFDFEGVYESIKTNALLETLLGDGRRVKIEFTGKGSETQIIETFEAETENSVELQKGGWQAILNNFKKNTESNQ